MKLKKMNNTVFYSVMQLDWNSSKIDTFYEPTTNGQHVLKSSEQIITFARYVTDE